MAKVKIKLNRAEVRKQLLKGPEITGFMEELAGQIQASCGEGYEVSIYGEGKTRANVSVYTATPEAMRDNLKNNTLLKAMGEV